MHCQKFAKQSLNIISLVNKIRHLVTSAKHLLKVVQKLLCRENIVHLVEYAQTLVNNSKKVVILSPNVVTGAQRIKFLFKFGR